MGNSEKVKIVIYIEIGLFILATISTAAFLIFAGAIQKSIIDAYVTDPKQRAEVEDMFKTGFVVIVIIIAVALLISLLLLWVLWAGHKQRSATKLKVWFILGCIGAVFMILGIISGIANNPRSFVMLIPNIIYAGYRVWALIAVKGLMNEIQDGPQQPPFQGVQYSNA